MEIKKAKDIIELCNKRGIHIYELIVDYEVQKLGKTQNEIRNYMLNCLNVMKESSQKALDDRDNSIKGKIISGDAKKLKNRYTTRKTVCGNTMAKAISYALSTMEVNASMGKIVAAPTAGSCGVLPAVLLSIEEKYNLSSEELINTLLTASAIGMIIGKNATLSGAEGGCQAEIGSSAAMAAGAVVEALGGTVEMAFDAAAMALKNLMGLVCDPIAGLVESPCSKRNAIGTANALISAEMALSGIESVVPFDEVVIAMRQVGRQLPCSLKETAQGGIAITPTALDISKKIFG